jgi:gamma-glutamyltranspeptidase / glutathione hydrolase
MLKADKNAPGGCRAPNTGEIMINPTLAATFRTLAKEGKDGFYKGMVAEAIIKCTSTVGGYLTLDDLKHHAEVGTEDSTPISFTLTAMGINAARGGLNIWEHPPNGQGIVALMALGILQELERSGKIKKWDIKEHNSIR